MKNLLCFFSSLYMVAYAETWSLQARAGYFLPASTLVRNIYHGGGVEPEIEGSYRVYEEWRAWANFNAFLRKGYTEGLHTPTSIQLYPLSAGIKYHFRLVSPLSLYLGIGPSITWSIMCNHSSYVKQRVVKNGWGVVGKSGFLYHFPKHIFLDLFADYSYTKIGSISYEGVQSQSCNVGGLRTGIGIGVDF